MKKKTFIVQLLNSKKPSRTSFTQVEDANFYSNDTDASLVFIPHEDTFDFQTAKVVMYNRSDESLVERDMVVTTEDGRKVASYELPDEIISHWGDWTAQPVFISGGEIYSGSIVPFSVIRYLMDNRPPTLRDVIKVDELYSQLVSVMDEIAGKDVISAPEIIMARGGENTLGERLDKEHNEVTTQLAQTTNEISAKPYRNEVRLKRESIGLDDADEELLSAIEGGEGTTFSLLSIPRVKSVTPATTTFMTSVSASKNLFNPSDPDIIEGKILNTDGSFSNNSAYNTSGFISVSPGDKISISKNDSGNTVLARAYGYYDENGNWLTGYSAPTNPDFPLTVPENAYSFRVTYSTTSYNEYQVEIGEVPTSYEPYIDNHLVDGNVKLSMDSLTGEDGVFSLEPASKNLFNPNDSDIVLGALLTTSGGFTNNSSYNVTGFIPVKQGDKVYISKKTTTSILVRSYGWYDKQKNWIEGKTWSSGNLLHPPFIAQEDGYFRATYTSGDNEEYQIEIGDGVTSYEPFVLKNFFNSQKVGIPENASIGNTGKSVSDLLTYWYGKKVVFQGDSITAGYLPTSYNEDAPSYAKLTSDELGMMYSNFAIGGSTIAENSESPTEKDPIVNRYQLQDDGADLVIVAAGTNDWSYAWTPVGTMADRTKNTFYGALHYLILGLLDKYPDKQLLFMTPIKRRSNPTMTNANGKTLEEYADIIKEVCGFYGIPVLDMFRECSILPHLESHRNLYIPDEVHPNGTGHRIMARRVTGYLKQLA